MMPSNADASVGAHDPASFVPIMWIREKPTPPSFDKVAVIGNQLIVVAETITKTRDELRAPSISAYVVNALAISSIVGLQSVVHALRNAFSVHDSMLFAAKFDNRNIDVLASTVMRDSWIGVPTPLMHDVSSHEIVDVQGRRLLRDFLLPLYNSICLVVIALAKKLDRNVYFPAI